MSDTQQHNLLAPRFWPNYLGFALVKLIAYLPYPVIYRLGRALGHLMYRLIKRRTQIARTNLELCFPTLSAEEREQWVKENILSTSIGLLETAMLWFGPQRNLKKYVKLQGMEHYQQAKEKGKGGLILGFHLTSLEIGGSALGQYLELAALYRQNENPLIEKKMVSGRANYVHSIPRTHTRDMIRWIKNNGMVWYAADQDYGREQSVFVPFFDIPTATITATSRFVKLTQAPVIPFTHRRKNNGKVLELILHPPLDIKGDDVEADARTINQFLESYLSQHPKDYLWVHRRFKTRPDEDQWSLYPARKKNHPITPERLKWLLEAANHVEYDNDQVVRIESDEHIIYVSYRDKGFKHWLNPPYKKLIQQLNNETINENHYRYQGRVRRCFEYNCDLVYLEITR
ncbi:LpxL/LpxP family Kdo(2)-lipid IV(A) lauroyl/palmitoleoyl acyltransferase [Pleionea sp. CnH1-48]|uniref:LpxL/LpxP family Kdo(2)-lipid IV(A) lauroyl/palmitoleoyl acyltransferase n=1 Tax=Pleionea sp. CnH1-48 TaxID=2954494 RepID=UPI002096A00D|nr:LpxL/LpxP family Kdo(2)-lipid IV(A) lauroyl/palmitoleoyl acyltransferase [Pleionea sp. CnH1-48]MCO7224631.1 LpxL/LpxP family Kdo(2)-lipid IV(A) lauroyl/palmitoleoyl acyltransferase [Pleionea sp. CnH1-48]